MKSVSSRVPALKADYIDTRDEEYCRICEYFKKIQREVIESFRFRMRNGSFFRGGSWLR